MKTPEEFQKHVSRVTKKRSKKVGLLKSLGIEFDPSQDDGVPAKSENEEKKVIEQEVVLEKKEETCWLLISHSPRLSSSGFQRS